MTGTRHTEGSDMRRLRNCVISLRVSSSPSSMFTSTTMAPFSICVRAISRASSYLCSFMSLRNFLDPATLHLSPTTTKSRFPNSNLSSPVTVSRSDFSPSSAMLAVPCGVSAVVWGFMWGTIGALWRLWFSRRILSALSRKPLCGWESCRSIRL